jgi:argininosuccinate lyase
VKPPLQWGGRFTAPPDPALLAFASSLAEDLVLAPFDLRCSKAHVLALQGGDIVKAKEAQALHDALDRVAAEIGDGSFQTFAQSSGAEDVHGAIDARVRALAGETGEILHAGRSRNDQVATTLLLYCADRAVRGGRLCSEIARRLLDQAEIELERKTLLAATTHWQPAQPVLLAFWLAGAAEPFARAATRFDRSRSDAMSTCPLGSSALAGSSLPLDREGAARWLGFAGLSRNAMDAIGNRDAALDLAHACVRAVAAASRVSEELVIWCTPAFGYAHLGDAAATGSSLMPQKRNPDPLELVRAGASDLNGRFAGALGTTIGIGLSYHRDLQVTKGAVITIVERALETLEAFARALAYVEFDAARMNASADESYTVATDVADTMIKSGVTAREAHRRVGEQILAAERDGASLDWPTAAESVVGKATAGSTNPSAVAAAIAALRERLSL